MNRRRSPLQRKKPIRRASTKLQRYKAYQDRMQRRLFKGALASMERLFELPKPIRRSNPLSKRGARSKRDEKALAEFRRAVLERAGWKCERCGVEQHPVYGPRMEAHHRRARSQGGKHDPAQGVCLCFICHDLITTHKAPDWRAWKDMRAPRK